MCDDDAAAAARGPDNTSDAVAAVAAKDQEAEAYEAEHVHAVYEAIAPHFSSTRHTPWPRVAAYLQSQRAGAVGLDVGCGNGKYLGVNRGGLCYLLGSDRSSELVRLAAAGGVVARKDDDDGSSCRALDSHLDITTRTTREQRGGGGGGGAEVAVADGLALPYRRGAFDFVICIAVVHHLSTRQRRVEALSELVARLRPRRGGGGDVTSRRHDDDDGDDDDKATALVFVWALEQASSRRGWDKDCAQDTLVPWVMRTSKGKGEGKGEGEKATFQRYYHLYRQGELEEDIAAAGGVVEESGYERDNWWAIFSRRGRD